MNSFLFGAFYVCMLCAHGADIQFETLSTLYLPYSYTPTPQYGLLQNAVEQIAYDPTTQLLYSVGNTKIHVIDVSDVTNPQILHHSSYVNVDVTDVEVCGGFVYVACNNKINQEEGYVDVYKGFDKSNGSMERMNRIIVGDLPDMILPTSDCKKLVVAIEARPYVDDVNNRLIDNAGGVVIIHFNDDVGSSYDIKTLGFEDFNDQFDELSKSGVRWVYRGINNSNQFSNDVEPEYITLNHDETKAYISLQENNAISVINMETENIEGIYGLGYKQWKDYTLDASDMDNEINMQPWSVFGIYQPDAIKHYTHGGVEYIIIANEGDAKDYPPYFSEEARVKELTLSNAFEKDPVRRAALQEDSQLGRLTVTTLEGQNLSTGEYDALYTFGGRSFSIRRAKSMELVYDSGDEIGRKTALLFPELFNNNPYPSATVSSTFDQRSDNKGSETESLAVADLSCITLLLIGNERPGTITVYSIENNDVIRPKFETIITGLPTNAGNETWETLYNNREVSLLDPEDIRFVPASESPNNEPLFLVTGSVTGTISIIKVKVECPSQQPEGPNPNSSANMRLELSLVALVATLIIFIV